MAEAVQRYEGTVAQFLGDGILAFFGAPVAHEDDAQRAVRAALEIQESVAALAPDLKRTANVVLRVRIGINTGPVIVGQVGSMESGTYSAIGDTLNTAARVQSAAEPSSTAVTESTYRLVDKVFDAADLGEIEVKGKAAPVHCYRIVGLRRADPSGESAATMHSPLIGRQEQLDKLLQLVSALQQGRGGVAVVVGEPGIGKSRLIGEVRSSSRQMAPDLLWLEGRAPSYGGSLPYGLVTQVLSSLFGTGLATDPAEAREAVAEKLDELLGAKSAEILPYVGHLLSIALESDSVDLDALEPEALQRRYGESLSLMLGSVAKSRPVVIVCEDLHWADASSAALLSKLIGIGEHARVLFLLTSRREPRAPGSKLLWDAREHFGEALTEIGLGPLSPEQCAAIAQELIGHETPDSLSDFLAEVTEGNPLFVEEVVRGHVLPTGATEVNWQKKGPGSLLESAYSLHSLLLSSIDRLPVEGRRVLKLASVIGREFSLDVLTRVVRHVDEPFDVSQQLSSLEASGVVAVIGAYPELVYSFRHALLQEAAYESLLKSERKNLHAAVGAALEDAYPQRTTELAGLLARHFAESRDEERTLTYSSLAADAAFSRYAISEAEAHYARALEIAVDRSDDVERLVHLFQRLGRSRELIGLYDEAVESYRRLEQLGRARNNDDLELAGLVAAATALVTPAGHQDIPEGERLAARALELARVTGNRPAESKSLWSLMLAFNFSGREPATAIRFGEESLAIARELGDLEQVSSTLLDLHWAYLANGQIDRSLQTLDEASRLWRQMGDKAMLADSLSCSSGLKLLMGDFEGVLVDAGKARSLSEQSENLWGQSFSRLYLFHAYLEMGRPAKAIATMRESILLAEQGDSIAGQVGTRADLGLTLAQLGAADEGLAIARKAVEESDKRSGTFKPWAVACLARVHLLRGEVNEAAAAMELVDPDSAAANLFLPFPIRFPLAIARAEVALARGDAATSFSLAGSLVKELLQLHLKFWLPQILLLQGRSAQALGRLDEALELLEEGRLVAREMGSLWSLRPIMTLLGEIEMQKGNTSRASWLAEEARILAEKFDRDLSGGSIAAG
jgi:tetratricopeptide (TPR) repeat protein